jgi:hypothetical protein
LTWSSSNASSFSINNYKSLTPNTAGSDNTISPNQSTDYTGTVTGGGVTNYCTASGTTPAGTLTISCIPATIYGCNGLATIVSTTTDQYCNTTTNNNVATCTLPGYCNAGGSTCYYSSPDPVPNGSQSGNLTLHPSLIPKGQTIKVYWNIQPGSAESCSVSGTNGDGPWTGLSSGSSGETSGSIEQQTTYTLSCLQDDGKTYYTQRATVNVVPTYQER